MSDHQEIKLSRYVADRIRKLLRQKEMNQGWLAAIIGVDTSYLSRVWSGNTGISISLVGEIAKALGVSYEKLFAGEFVNVAGFHFFEQQKGGCEIWVNDVIVTPAYSQAVWNHSPDGFNWGYGGSGPAQLALAILLEIMGRPEAVKHHQQFKFDFIVPLKSETDFQFQFSLEEWLGKVRKNG